MYCMVCGHSEAEHRGGEGSTCRHVRYRYDGTQAYFNACQCPGFHSPRRAAAPDLAAHRQLAALTRELRALESYRDSGDWEP